MDDKKVSKSKYFDKAYDSYSENDFTDESYIEPQAKIKVLGIGGAGNNAINNMIRSGLEGVEFIAANTDFQDLRGCLADIKIPLGRNITRGLGAGGNPELGAKATEEDLERIKEVIDGSDMVFITAGLGGGTGTGGAPIVAKVCKELGILTVAVVTKPFKVEGRMREKNAKDGLRNLEEVVDTIITIPNDRLITLSDKRATFIEMLKKADDILYYAVKGISDLIVSPGYINLDFADVRSVMSEMGLALMGTGVGRGENRASDATHQAISSPLLEDISIHGAKAVLVNITASSDLTMHEFEEVSTIISEEAAEDANVYLGMAIDDSVGEELRVTVIATGIGSADKEKVKVRPESSKVVRVRPKNVRTLDENRIPDPDYDYLEIPTIERHSSAGSKRRVGDKSDSGEEIERQKKRSFLRKIKRAITDEEDLNIPTFIRRQVD